MNVSQSGIAVLYLSALLLGAALGPFYDAIRIIRIFLGVHARPDAIRRLQRSRFFGANAAVPHAGGRRLAGVAVFAGDFLFCIVAAVALILLFYERNSGRIRVFAIVCAVAGFFAYRATLGRLVMLLSEIVAYLLLRLVRWAVGVLTAPIRNLLRLLKKALIAVSGRLRERRFRSERRRWTAAMFRRIPMSADGLLPGGAVLEAEPRDPRHCPEETNEGKTDDQPRKKKKKTVQPEPAGAGVSRVARRRFAHRVRNEHHAGQRAGQGEKTA